MHTLTSSPENKTAINAESLINGRSSGVLLHISCLPSDYGIGDMGAAAYQFADRLHTARQKYWQILPLNPSNASSGESPYFSSSAFAGNPLLVDLDALVEEGLLAPDDIHIPAHLPESSIDFARVRKFKLQTLFTACENFKRRGSNPDFEQFCEQQKHWLEDFALFTALKDQYDTASWAEWPVEIRDRDAAAIERAQLELANEMERVMVLQYFFFRQWQSLKNYCNNKSIIIFGDMPIYVSFESADVWANSEIFKLDGERRPTAVSGVPPDYFSATGQLWNNPVYDWQELKQQNYRWWIDRMGALFECFDIVRIDHFRGLVQYWEVPAGSETAINGSWEDVPTYEFFDALIAAYPHFPVVVEDLGIITPDVVDVKNHYNFPGMLILQFAFGDEDDRNPYLPQNHPQNALVYLGTHDNTTIRGWIEEASDEAARNRLFRHIEASENIDQLIANLIDLLMSSKADIAIVTAQDLLGLPARARMNDPAVNFGNWAWRLTRSEFDAMKMDLLAELTEKYRRVWPT